MYVCMLVSTQTDTLHSIPPYACSLHLQRTPSCGHETRGPLSPLLDAYLDTATCAGSRLAAPASFLFFGSGRFEFFRVVFGERERRDAGGGINHAVGVVVAGAWQTRRGAQKRRGRGGERRRVQSRGHRRRRRRACVEGVGDGNAFNNPCPPPERSPTLLLLTHSETRTQTTTRLRTYPQQAKR